jgi:hypothetical protein
MRKKRPSYIRKIATLFPPIKVTWRAIFPKQQIEPGTLILVRHGESGTYARKIKYCNDPKTATSLVCIYGKEEKWKHLAS